MGGAKPWAWAGVKHGTGEAVTDFMALAEMFQNAVEFVERGV